MLAPSFAPTKPAIPAFVSKCVTKSATGRPTRQCHTFAIGPGAPPKRSISVPSRGRRATIQSAAPPLPGPATRAGLAAHNAAACPNAASPSACSRATGPPPHPTAAANAAHAPSHKDTKARRRLCAPPVASLPTAHTFAAPSACCRRAMCQSLLALRRMTRMTRWSSVAPKLTISPMGQSSSFM